MFSGLSKIFLYCEFQSCLHAKVALLSKQHNISVFCFKMHSHLCFCRSQKLFLTSLVPIFFGKILLFGFIRIRGLILILQLITILSHCLLTSLGDSEKTFQHSNSGLRFLRDQYLFFELCFFLNPKH